MHKGPKTKSRFVFWRTVYLHVPCIRAIGAERKIMQEQKQAIINKDSFNS